MFYSERWVADQALFKLGVCKEPSRLLLHLPDSLVRVFLDISEFAMVLVLLPAYRTHARGKWREAIDLLL